MAGTTDKSGYGVPAIIYKEANKTSTKHPSGHYFNTNMPIDQETGMATMDYKDAEDVGFIKLDLLNNNAMARFSTMVDYYEAINTEPDWELLWTRPDYVKGLPQVGRHYEMLCKIKPRSIIELADVLALIRPAKVDLIQHYLNDPTKMRSILYNKTDKYYFKKSHAVAYAYLIVAVMNSRIKQPIESFVTINRG